MASSADTPLQAFKPTQDASFVMGDALVLVVRGAICDDINLLDLDNQVILSIGSRCIFVYTWATGTNAHAYPVSSPHRNFNARTVIPAKAGIQLPNAPNTVPSLLIIRLLDSCFRRSDGFTNSTAHIVMTNWVRVRNACDLQRRNSRKRASSFVECRLLPRIKIYI